MKTQIIPLEQHEKEVSALKEELSYLKEQLNWFKKQLFGQKSERLVDKKKDLSLYFEGFDRITTVAEEKQNITSHERSKRVPNGKDKISFPADIPIERHILDIPDEKKICPETGKPLVKIGEEISSKLAHRPGS